MVLDKVELRKSLDHLAFDVQHFRCYIDLRNNSRLGQLCPAARQAVVYSLLLHLRLLLDFFYGPPRLDDCWVGHFRVLPGFSRVFPSKLSKGDAARELSIHLHKRLAHLTATRWRKRAPSMTYYEKYFQQIDELIDIFGKALPDDLRASFEVELKRWEKVHPSTF